MQDLAKIQKRIIESRDFRKSLAASSFYWFFHIYFAHYLKYPTAEFQKEICDLCQDDSIPFVEIVGFRGCAKSSIISMAFPIWRIITGKSHYPILGSDTSGQAKQLIFNLKVELETNRLLISDWGPFESTDEWTATNIVLTGYDARLQARSTGQRMRGLRHKEHRPDLFIPDDIENLESVRTKEQRDKDERWLLAEALPALDPKAKVVLSGNLLHSDSLVVRIKRQILNGERRGVIREYPIVDGNNILWPGRFPDMAAIDELKRTMRDPSGNPLKTWQREYLLHIVPEEGQAITEEDIHYYEELPEKVTFGLSGTGTDLAISQKQTADCTAMVSGKIATIEGHPQIYIGRNPINAHLDLYGTIQQAKGIKETIGCYHQFFVEDVAYQKAAIDEFQRNLLPVIPMRPINDKRARLNSVAPYIKNGTVLFPRIGCEDLIVQLLGFGIEAHDDMVDALVYLIMGLVNQGMQEMKIVGLL
jgi:predicted phage terminase large subunit-like protein